MMSPSTHDHTHRVLMNSVNFCIMHLRVYYSLDRRKLNLLIALLWAGTILYINL